MVFTFSGNLLNQIQVVRQQNQIEKIASSEILEFSLNEWNNFSSLNEIKFQNNYYDIISFEKINSKIVAKVVKDDFENEVRITFLKVFNKHQSPLSHKKKTNSFSNYLPCDFASNNFEKINFNADLIQHKSQYLLLRTSNFINFLEKPPGLINFYDILK